MSDVLRIGICDDMESDILVLRKILDECNFSLDISIFDSGEALLEIYIPGKFDLLLMDVYMGGITGIETISEIRKIDPEVPVAFITSSSDFALESYRLSALKYIEKPFKKEDIMAILDLAQMKKNSAPTLVVQKNGKYQKIPLNQIVYIEQNGRLIEIYLYGKDKIEVYDKISSVLPQMENQPFFRSHKSYLVNFNFVRYIDKELKCFVMANEKNVPIRREFMGKAKKELENFLFNRLRGSEHD